VGAPEVPEFTPVQALIKISSFLQPTTVYMKGSHPPFNGRTKCSARKHFRENIDKNISARGGERP